MWPVAARELVRANKDASGVRFRVLIDRLVQETGNNRKSCSRFVRRMGVRWKRVHKPWTEADQERLKKLVEKDSVSEIARKMRRSESSVWHMIQRLKLDVRIGRDRFTKYTLARALHVRVHRVEDWINRGWLITAETERNGTKSVLIEGEDFVHFCMDHTKDAVGADLSEERLEFVCRYAFPRSHEYLMDVRASKKERAAYEAQSRSGNGVSSISDDDQTENERSTTA